MFEFLPLDLKVDDMYAGNLILMRLDSHECTIHVAVNDALSEVRVHEFRLSDGHHRRREKLRHLSFLFPINLVVLA